MQKPLRYVTDVPYGYDILNLSHYVGATDIKLVPLLQPYSSREMQLLLWTDVYTMLQYLNGAGGWSYFDYKVKNLTDVSRTVGKVYCAFKFTFGSVTNYGYFFHTPYIIPPYDTAIIGWTANATYVNEVADSI